MERKSEYLRDQVWLDQTCTLGYSVAGTWNNLSYKNDPTTTTAVHVGGHRCVNIRVGFSQVNAIKGSHTSVDLYSNSFSNLKNNRNFHEI